MDIPTTLLNCLPLASAGLSNIQGALDVLAFSFSFLLPVLLGSCFLSPLLPWHVFGNNQVG